MRIAQVLKKAVLLIAGPTVIAAGGLYWYVNSGRYITTENAYVRAETIRISTNVDGQVAKVFVDDNQPVSQGEVLFTLDTRPFRLALDGATAEVETVAQRVAALRAQFKEGEDRIAAARERIRFLEKRYERQKTLQQKGVSSQKAFDDVEHDLITARQMLGVARQTNEMVRAELNGGPDVPLEQHPAYLTAESKRQRAALDLEYASIVAPVDGRIGRVTLQKGEYVEAGDALFALVEDHEPWIEANLKEVQLTHISEGQAARVVIDAYPDITFQATVESISPATGAEFTILPPQNASGNWVKVVQRVPVRLRILPILDGPILRAGMTAEISIDTERERDLAGVISQVLPKPRP